MANWSLICQTFPCQCFTNRQINLMAAGSTGILKYFRSVRPSSSLTTPTLPDLYGLLSERILAKAIKLANAEVKQSKESSRGRRPTYMILTPSQHYEVGRRASEHVVTACLRYFSKKYWYTILLRASILHVYEEVYEWPWHNVYMYGIGHAWGSGCSLHYKSTLGLVFSIYAPRFVLIR